MKRLLLSLLLLTLIPLPSQAQELPDFVVKAVAEITIYDAQPFTDETRLRQGSGVFVDHGGCLFTNAHVVLDLDTDEPDEHIVVRVTTNRAQKPEMLYEGEVVFVDQAVDLAYVCPIESNQIFTHFFERALEPAFTTTPFGKEIWIMGFPGAGEGTITISPGHIVGFVEQPNIEFWVGIPDLDPDQLKMYKTDALSGPGVSGGMLVDRELNLIGVPFAGSQFPGAFVFSLSEDVLLDFERRTHLHLLKEGLVPQDCIFDWASQYYVRAGEQYYDNQCEYPFDATMEQEVKQTWRAFCGTDISDQRKVAALRRSKELGDLGAWSSNLELICPKAVADSDNQVAEQELAAGDFAYGKARLSSLEQEQSLAKSLKSEIDTQYPELAISEQDWSTVVNSYIYGGYPLEAINKAIELGGKTVHPEIPYSSWQGSVEYQTYL